MAAPQLPGQTHPIGNYQFRNNKERADFDTVLTTTDECSAYINYASQPAQAALTAGHARMRRFLGLVRTGLDPQAKNQLVQNEANQRIANGNPPYIGPLHLRNGPLAPPPPQQPQLPAQAAQNQQIPPNLPNPAPVAVDVWFTDDDDAPTNLEEAYYVTPPPPGVDPQGLNWRFAKMLLKKSNGNAHRRGLVSVRLYIGEDPATGTVVDRIVLKVEEWATPNPVTGTGVSPPVPNHVQHQINEQINRYHMLAQKTVDSILRPRAWANSTFCRDDLDAQGNVNMSDPPPPGWEGPKGQTFPLQFWYHGTRSYTDFLAGGDLDALFAMHFEAQTKVPEIFLWIILRDIAIALDYLARQVSTTITGDQLHGDIKPSNVLLRKIPGQYPQPVLADFDLAVELRAGHDTPGQAGGTDGYRPPEQVRGLRATHRLTTTMTPKADIWALGGVVWNLMNTHLAMLIDVRNLQDKFFRRQRFDNHVNHFQAQVATFETTLAKLRRQLHDGPMMVALPPQQQRWTQSLKGVVNECTRNAPTQRPTARDVILRAQEQLKEICSLIGIDRLTAEPAYDFAHLVLGQEQFAPGRAYVITRRR
ncbi:kinase-like protein [Bimuria novae-zelandiae CBS 107.79]|uniref:non-specific serine/threonine protein kinase n=1 Tax=Bimuria novae-zelandiae CBS 107.79 TaxID=1447943 RepID=A0A6A5UZI0_9PLEO|nr:kinase-like protein [Bimuria novae-zelandiae CBS 107.79]